MDYLTALPYPPNYSLQSSIIPLYSISFHLRHTIYPMIPCAHLSQDVLTSYVIQKVFIVKVGGFIAVTLHNESSNAGNSGEGSGGPSDHGVSGILNGGWDTWSAGTRSSSWGTWGGSIRGGIRPWCGGSAVVPVIGRGLVID